MKRSAPNTSVAVTIGVGSGRRQDVSWVVLTVAIFVGLTSCAPSRPATPNVLLLMVDSLRSDHLGFAGYQRPVSPCLDSLAARGAAFTACVAQAPYTIASVPSILTGLYPSSACYTAEIRVKGLGTSIPTYRLGGGVRTIASVLGERGYRTGAFVANGDVAVRNFGISEQFDHMDAEHLCDSGDCADRLNNAVVEWLSSIGREPWLCYVHYMDVHYPYAAPPEWATRFSPGYESMPLPTIGWMRRHGRRTEPDADELRYVTGMYDAEIAYVDDRICALLSCLRDLDMAENLLLVVCSDHGEEFYEHGGFGHKRTLYEELLRCPLILVWEGHVSEGVLARTPVQNVDIVPTVLDLIGIQPSEAFEGASLLPLFSGVQPDRSVFSEKQGAAVRKGPWKLWEAPDGVTRLFRLDVDSLERSNLAHAEPETLRSLQTSLLRWKQSLKPPTPASGEVELPSLDEDHVAMLRELGYID